MILNTKHGEVKIFTENIEQEALKQVIELGNSVLGENANIRIMPDVHAGKGCTIGTTMKITDKVCPNIVGVDIGCGVTMFKTNIDFENNLEVLDSFIRKNIPHGKKSHDMLKPYDLFDDLKCWNKLPKNVQELSQKSLGTLGGGNHFIEAYNGGCIAVHSGSRNIGLSVAKYYQEQAEKQLQEYNQTCLKNEMLNIPKEQRKTWLQQNKVVINKNLSYLQGDLLENYLHDIKIIQMFAVDNRREILYNIVDSFTDKPCVHCTIESTHNYIDVTNMILRKGAIAAEKGTYLVIPLNMRDGLLLCKGKGNEDWNCSAPHGAGRLYSRSKAKEQIKLEDFEKSMQGIYTTCVNENTIDESPFAYKDYQEIIKNIEPTVEILERLIPIYNFKSN